ncbi:MAG: CHAD domain-containing protein [Bryobacteraceae bacterium]
METAARRGLKASILMRDYAVGQAADLLRRTAFQANRAGMLPSADAVHDLRVSIRRLTQCLRAFRQFFPEAGARKVRQRLKAMLDLASEVRNRDVALDLLRRAAVPSGAPLLEVLAEERARAEQALLKELRLWKRKNIQKKWRVRLGF